MQRFMAGDNRAGVRRDFRKIRSELVIRPCAAVFERTSVINVLGPRRACSSLPQGRLKPPGIGEAFTGPGQRPIQEVGFSSIYAREMQHIQASG
jgi:hypothetical protein